MGLAEQAAPFALEGLPGGRRIIARANPPAHGKAGDGNHESLGAGAARNRAGLVDL